MILRRETNPTRVNDLLNHPSVRPWIANGSDRVDVSQQVMDEKNLFLFGEFGGVGFIFIQPGIYEAHTQVLPEGRGAWTRDLTESCVKYMFTRTEACDIITRVPSGHVAAKAAAEAQGMRLEFTRSNGVMFRNKIVDCHILSFRIQDWVARTTTLAETGQWLHDRMAAEADRLGLKHESHEPDLNHNQYTGAAVEMMFGGQPWKAVSLYNRWVTSARHMRNGKLQHIKLMAIDPPMVQFDIGLLQFKDNDVEVVLSC